MFTVKLPTSEETAKKLAESAMHAFIVGKKVSKKWVIGEIRYSGVTREVLKKLVLELPLKYPQNLQTIRELKQELNKESLL